MDDKLNKYNKTLEELIDTKEQILSLSKYVGDMILSICSISMALFLTYIVLAEIEKYETIMLIFFGFALVVIMLVMLHLMYCGIKSLLFISKIKNKEEKLIELNKKITEIIAKITNDELIILLKENLKINVETILENEMKSRLAKEFGKKEINSLLDCFEENHNKKHEILIKNE